jgi:hypothetical protein
MVILSALAAGSAPASPAAASAWVLVLGFVGVTLLSALSVLLVAGRLPFRHPREQPTPQSATSLRRPTGPITNDELIDVHIALANVVSLRTITGRRRSQSFPIGSGLVALWDSRTRRNASHDRESEDGRAADDTRLAERTTRRRGKQHGTRRKP